MVVHDIQRHEGALLEMLSFLRQGAQESNAITVRILAAADHDGVCATKILVSVLQRSGVKNTIIPVTANAEIVEHIRQLDQDAEVRSLVLLNCGASLDLQGHLDACVAPAGLRCFVIDAHRPFLLANLSARHHQIIVLDDDPVAQETGRSAPIDELDGDDGSSAAEESGGSDAEKENVWDPEAAAAPGGAVPTKPAGQVEAEHRARKRRREADRQERAKRKRQRINEYYSTAYYAMPTAMSLFKMARQSAAPSSDHLWLAAVSLLGYQEQGLISEIDYWRWAEEELKEALHRVSEFAIGSSQSSGGTQRDSLAGPSDEEDELSSAPARRRRLPRSSGQGRRRLRWEADLRVTLYKHWTLEEAMMHSAYFYGTLELHRDKGLRSLKNFFATAGIPPSDYGQLFSCMQIPIRKSLHKKFRDHGKGYGMTEPRMFLNQFVRDLGPMGETNHALLLHELSCSDAVNMVIAMLSSVPPALSSMRADLLPKTADGRRDTVAITEMERQALVENFWRAYDAVVCKDPGPLRDGIAEAVEAAKAVQSLARMLKDTKAMRSSRQFRWCKIEQPPRLFRHHIAVRRLAMWLLKVLFIYRPKGEGPDTRPLLVIVRDRMKDTYLCVGATPTIFSARGEDEFANLYRSVLRTDPTLKIRYDFFDKSCIEVAADDFDRFWDLMVGGSAE